LVLFRGESREERIEREVYLREEEAAREAEIERRLEQRKAKIEQETAETKREAAEAEKSFVQRNVPTFAKATKAIDTIRINIVAICLL